MSTKVYIAGPMTGHPEYNYPAFYAAEAWLEARGFECVNPARLDAVTELDLLEAGLDPDAPGGLGEGSALPVYLRRDFKELVECDGIVLLDGWRDSPGANAEVGVARWLDLKVWKLVEEGGLLALLPSAALPNRGIIYDTWQRFGYLTFQGQQRIDRQLSVRGRA